MYGCVFFVAVALLPRTLNCPLRLPRAGRFNTARRKGRVHTVFLQPGGGPIHSLEDAQTGNFFMRRGGGAKGGTLSVRLLTLLTLGYSLDSCLLTLVTLLTLLTEGPRGRQSRQRYTPKRKNNVKEARKLQAAEQQLQYGTHDR